MKLLNRKVKPTEDDETLIQKAKQDIIVKIDKDGGFELSYKNIVNLVKLVMEAVEVSKIKGGEKKKEAVIRLVRDILEEFDNDDEHKKSIVDLIEDGTISALINVIVDATKGKVNINKILKLSEKLIKTIYNMSRVFCCKKKD